MIPLPWRLYIVQAQAEREEKAEETEAQKAKYAYLMMRNRAPQKLKI